METKIILALVIGILAIFSLVAVNFVTADTEEQEVVEKSPSCGGGCTSGQTCGIESCVAKQGKSCGCGR